MEQDELLSCASAKDNKALREALDTFIASVPVHERDHYSQCTSAAQLVEDTAQLAIIAKDKIHGKTFLEQIKLLADKLAPYFDILDILVQSHPEYAALVWGALRFILKVSF